MGRPGNPPGKGRPREYPGTPGGEGRKGPLLKAVTAFLNLVEVGLGCIPGVKGFYRRELERLEARERVLPCDPGQGALEGLRIALVSDIHAGPFLGEGQARLILEKVRAARPEMIFLAGDLIAQGDRDLDLLAPFLEGLDSPLGVYAVTGNHEFFHGDPEIFTERLSSAGIQVLRNRGVRVERGEGTFWICGVDDPGEGNPDLGAALEGKAAGEPALLLCHHPDFFPVAAREGVVLQVSGHTHGGQVRLPGWVPMRHTRLGYLEGLFREGESLLYVSRGIGAILLPLRLGAPAELPILSFRGGIELEPVNLEGFVVLPGEDEGVPVHAVHAGGPAARGEGHG